MELIILATVNILLFIWILFIDWNAHRKQRMRFYRRITKTSDLRDNSISWMDHIHVAFPFVSFAHLHHFHEKLQAQRNRTDEVPFTQQIKGAHGVVLLILGIVSSWLISFSTGISWMLVLLAFFLLGGGIYLWSQQRIMTIRTHIQKQLPEILEIMARVYRVHSDLRYALEEVVRSQSDHHVKRTFAEMLSLSRFGYTVEEAMEYVARQIGSEDLNFVVASIQMNTPVGGDLSYLLERTAVLLRQRKDAHEEIQSVMFQSKFSAIASAFLVPIIVVVSVSTNPDYQDILFFDPTGRLLFIGCLLWWIIGVIIIHKNARVTI